MIVNSFCHDCPSGVTISDISDIQTSLDSKIAKEANKKRASKKNNLSLKFNRENYKRLVTYNNILEEIKYCNSCYGDYDIHDILNLAKTALNGRM